MSEEKTYSQEDLLSLCLLVTNRPGEITKPCWCGTSGVTDKGEIFKTFQGDLSISPWIMHGHLDDGDSVCICHVCNGDLRKDLSVKTTKKKPFPV